MKIENNDNFLQMLLSDKENLLTENYHIKLSLEELQLLNPFFRMFESILGCAESLANIIRDSNPKLLLKGKDAILIIIIYIPGGKEKEVELVLKKNE